jgi:subtilisin family serine protease
MGKRVSGRVTVVGAVAVFLLLASMAVWALAGGDERGGPPRGDLSVGEVVPDAVRLEQGAKLKLVVGVRNKGATTVATPRLKVFFSKNKRVDRRDATLGRSTIRRLKARMSRRVRMSVAVPQQAEPGPYWLIACGRTKTREASHKNNCSSPAAVRVIAGGSIGETSPPVPPSEGEEKPNLPVMAKVGSCRPGLILSAEADRPAVAEGEQVEYSASIRSDPVGACLDVEGAQTVSGTVAVTASVTDLAMWLEISDGSEREVLPASAGLTTSGTTVPEACPGGEVSGCEAGIQAVVGNVFYSEGKARGLEAGEEAEIPFRFFPILSSEDLERIAAAPPGAVRFVVVAETDDGHLLLSGTPATFSVAQWLEGVELAADLPHGEHQVSPVGSISPGGEVDLEAFTSYLVSTEDPDVVVASFQANAEDPEAVSSLPSTVSTVVTNDPSLRPDVFPTASPSAATVDTIPTVLVGVALNGEVEEAPSVTLEGPETLLGTLNDEGVDGDAVAGDGIWAGQVQVPMEETRTLRVDVLLDGTERAGSVEVQALPPGAPTEPAATPSQQTIVLGNGAIVLNDRIVIHMAEGSDYSDVAAAGKRVAGTVVGRISSDTWQIGTPPVTDETELNSVLAEVSMADSVIGAEPESVDEETDVAPNDPLYGSQPFLPQIEANRAWIIARGSSPRVAVAVIDTGVDRDHPDLVSRLLPGPDLAEHDGNPEDTCGHGTHVAGIIGAATNNGLRVAGVNWNAALIPIKVFPDVAGPSQCHAVGAVNLAAAIRWAVDHGAMVINMSLAGPHRSEADVAALEYAWNAGRVVVAAAGNSGSSAREYPAGYERTEQFSSWFGLSKRTYHTDVLAVGNVMSSDARAPKSNFGSWVDVAAPGTNILSTYLNGGTATLTGTSMAAPVVSGVASLMTSVGVLGPERIRSLLINTGKQINQGVGPRVNAFEAVFNGSFEGGLETWSPQGTVLVVPRLGPIVPSAGQRMLELSTGPDAAEVQASVRKVMQLPANALRNGKVDLSLKYDFVTEEYPEYVGSEFNDTMLIVVRLPNGEAWTLADESVNSTNWTPVSGIDFPGGDSTVGQSGWKSASTSIPAAALGGSGEITIEVFDVGDEIYDSVGLIDVVRLD